MNSKNDKSWIAGVALAVSASLCCITPVLALISGVSGIAATFAWLEPIRPYLIGITILVLAFAWYQKLKPRKQEEVSCDCETDGKPSFWQSRTFLGIITVFAALMITFPHYGHIFYPKSPVTNVIFVERNNIQQIEFKISGMTCASCAEHVNYEVHKLNGIIKSNTSYENGTATIEFNNSEITASEIEKSINSTGYPVISKK